SPGRRGRKPGYSRVVGNRSPSPSDRCWRLAVARTEESFGNHVDHLIVLDSDGKTLLSGGINGTLHPGITAGLIRHGKTPHRLGSSDSASSPYSCPPVGAGSAKSGDWGRYPGGTGSYLPIQQYMILHKN